MDRQRRKAWAYLSRVADGPNSTIQQTLARCGPLETAQKVACGELWLAHTAGVAAPDRSEEDLELLDALGGRLVTPEDDEWPHEALSVLASAAAGRIPTPPIALWVLGRRSLDEVTGSAVVTLEGTLSPTDHGRQAAAGLAGGLWQRGWAVLTAARRGVGSAILEAALVRPAEAAIAVLSNCGFQALRDRPDAARLWALLDRGGTIISEYAPTGSPTHSPSALVRRSSGPARLLAALSAATVVIEPETSGPAAQVADQARALGRFLGVAAAPGAAAERGSTVVRFSDDIITGLRPAGWSRPA